MYIKCIYTYLFDDISFTHTHTHIYLYIHKTKVYKYVVWARRQHIPFNIRRKLIKIYPFSCSHY